MSFFKIAEQTQVPKDATEAAVEAQLQAQINPPVVTPPLPWSAA